MGPYVHAVPTTLGIRLIAALKGAHERFLASVNANVNQYTLMALEYACASGVRTNELLATLSILTDDRGFPFNRGHVRIL